MSDLFNHCLSEGVYPDSLKVAEVIPIFKKGDHDKTSNCRPISLLCQFNKIFEKLLHSRIYSYLVRYKPAVSSVAKRTLSVREVWVSIPRPVKSTQCRQGLATVATFLRSCVAQALSRGDGPRYSLHASA